MSPTSDFNDFVLQIWAQDGAYYAKVTDSPVGGSEIVKLESLVAVNEKIETLRLRLENALLRSASKVRSAPLTAAVGTSPAEAVFQQFGDAIFDRVFRKSDTIADFYSRSLAVSDTEERKGIRVKLRIDDPQLAQLPWEYLYNKKKDEWLGLQHRSPIIRFMDVGRAVSEITVTGKLRILGMISNPGGLWENLDADKERRLMEDAMAPLQADGQVEFQWVNGARAEDLVDMIGQTQWHVFHFIGHGGVEPADSTAGTPGQGFVVMADELGVPKKVTSSDLKVYLQGPHGDPPRLVILNCCESAREGGGDFASPAATLIKAGIPAVVAMQFPITDASAAKFSGAFYKRLVENLPIEAALTHARIVVQTSSRAEWGIPVLYTRSNSGRLFKSISPEPAASPAPKAAPVGSPASMTARERLRQLYAQRAQEGMARQEALS